MPQRGYVWQGNQHRLKLVIEPEQVEFYAQLDLSDDTVTVEDAAKQVLKQPDDATLVISENLLVVDLATKIIEQYELSEDERVLSQYILSACGCGGGGTQGKRKEYTYWTHSNRWIGWTWNRTGFGIRPSGEID